MLNDSVMKNMTTNEQQGVTLFYNTFRGFAEFQQNVVMAAYVLLKVSEDDSICTDTLEDYLRTSGEKGERATQIQNAMSNIWNSVVQLRGKISSETLKTIVLYDDCGSRMTVSETPVGLSKLTFLLMNIKAGDQIADFCTGYGSVIREFSRLEPGASYYGNDICSASAVIAEMRAELLGGSIEIKQEDLFEMEGKAQYFDAAFSNYPFGMRARDKRDAGGEYVRSLIDENSVFAKGGTSMDWIFNEVVRGMVKESGRAVCIMTNGSTLNTMDKAAREYFIKSGAVEAVIALPGRLFEGTVIPTSMIVLSHGNKDVMMVDARELCVKGRRQNIITEENAVEIFEACQRETEYSKRISLSELEANEYVLYPERYQEQEITIQHGVEFGTVIKGITRGAQLRASQLDDLVSVEPTSNQYLMLGNIQNGVIDNELPYLTQIDESQKKYCLKHHDLIISKSGAPFKVAVAEVEDGMEILATGNLYIIELDETKVDPYYIKAFLESDAGSCELNRIVVGATIPNIGVAQLKTITVPVPPMEEQAAIANQYRGAIAEVKELRQKIEVVQERMKHLFDDSI